MKEKGIAKLPAVIITAVLVAVIAASAAYMAAPSEGVSEEEYNSLEENYQNLQQDYENLQETQANLIRDPIKIETGYISGTILGSPENKVRVYRGIPYAAPPVGDMRWKPPQEPASWSGVREMTDFSKHSMQMEQEFCPPPYSENCLYLNVLTPAEKRTDNLPVMVWFHGGGFSLGSGNERYSTSLSIPQEDVILVTVNTRLGPFGHLALPALSEESAHDASGNYMLMDLIASLEWVQRNIDAFGGNPNNVTIFGESGGAGKVDALMASPEAEGLFHRAIYQSGVASEGHSVLSLEEAEELGKKLMANLGIEPDNLEALRATPPEEILEAGQEIEEYSRASIHQLVVDNHLLPDYPTTVFQAGEQNDVPLITCANLGELIVPEENTYLNMAEVVYAYKARMSSANELGTDAYSAVFTQVPSKWEEEGVLAYHGLEIPYIFGLLDRLSSPLHYAIFAGPSGAKRPVPGVTEEDEQLAEAIRGMWTQFAKTGNPSIEGVDWPSYDPETEKYLEIGWPLEVRSGLPEVLELDWKEISRTEGSGIPE